MQIKIAMKYYLILVIIDITQIKGTSTIKDIYKESFPVN